MDLIQMLTSQLGVSDKQASGGACLLFKMAQDKLGDADFGQVASAVPGIAKLISSAPKSGGLGGALGGFASSFGGGAGKLGDLASLASGFKKLDLDSGMASQFIPIIMSFVQSQGGDAIQDILAKVLK